MDEDGPELVSPARPCDRCGHSVASYQGRLWHVRWASDGVNLTITAMGCRSASAWRTGDWDDALPKWWQAR